MRGKAYLKWLGVAAALGLILAMGTADYAQIAKDKGIEAALFTIEGKETVRLKIWATLPEGTKIEVTIGQNKITFTWTAEAVKQGFLDTGHLELAGSEIFVKLWYEKTPNECRIPVGEVPKQSYKAFCKLRPAFFSVTGLDLPSSARINTSVSIAATIKNTGEETGTKDVWLEIDGREVERRRDVRLAPNESTTVRFTRSFSSTGRYSVRVATPDDARSSTLSIESRPAYFYVGSVSTSPGTSFPVNTTATFSALIENRGDETGTKPVWLEIDGSRVRETTLTLRPGQSDTVRFSYTFTSSGRYTARIRSPDDYSSTEVTVQARPAPPRASFSCSPTSGRPPLTVSCYDQSSGEITSWYWDWGDGTTSSERNPSHTYTRSGRYQITLTVRGPGGNDSRSFCCVEVLQTGDVRVTLIWSSKADLDLYVVDPNGCMIWFDNRSCPSGGRLDVDSNADCAENVTTNPVENIFWPSGQAPRGEYRVYVNYWASCGASSTQSFKVRILVDGETREFTGSISCCNQENADHPQVLVTTFRR